MVSGDPPVGDVEARQVVGSITEEMQQCIAGLRHHLWNRFIPITLRNNEATGRGEEQEPVMNVYL